MQRTENEPQIAGATSVDASAIPNTNMIDPTHIQSVVEGSLLAKLLYQHPELKYIKSNDPILQPFQLKYDLIQVPCQSNQAVYHYYVIDVNAKIGEGGFGMVCLVLGKIKIVDMVAIFYKCDDKVVKIQNHNFIDPVTYRVHRPIQSVMDEYKLTPPFIQMKEPIIWGNQSYLFMQRIAGLDMVQHIRLKNINAKNLCPLSLKILYALYDQVFYQDKIHRDIKPENIMGTPDGIFFIDWGLAKQSTDPELDGILCGTINYLDPYVIKTTITNQRSDFYSTCKALWAIWHTVLEQIDNQEIKTKILHVTNILFAKLCHADASVRPTYEQTVAYFENDYLKARQKSLPSHLTPAQLDATYQSAIAFKAAFRIIATTKLGGVNDEVSMVAFKEMAALIFSSLTDDPYLIQQFLVILNISCLQNINNKQDLINKFNQVINNYQDSIKELDKIADTYSYAKTVLSKRAKFNLSLDNLLLLDTKFKKFISKFNVLPKSNAIVVKSIFSQQTPSTSPTKNSSVLSACSIVGARLFSAASIPTTIEETRPLKKQKTSGVSR